MANVLLIGSGGREHALAWKLAQGENVVQIFVLPGNAGISTVSPKVICCSVPLPPNETLNFDQLVEFCQKNRIKLVIIGPEEHLERGVVEVLSNHSIECFGPTSAAAKLETSKAFAKDFMLKYDIPTARYANFTDTTLAIDHIKNCGYKAWVIKASGLAAGKGVTVARSNDEAIRAVKECLDERKFKNAGAEIVVEELLEGQEISALAFTDGHCVKLMPFAQDHKRLLDNDQGPNTGGMGVYAPVMISDEYRKTIEEQILMKTIDSIRIDGITYKGVLFAGIMLTRQGPLVLEFNCRFGDPETQVLMRLLKSDLFSILTSCVDGTLSDRQIEWFPDQLVCGVVLASGGYPDSYETGYEITGLDDVKRFECNAIVFHSGTKSVESTITNGIHHNEHGTSCNGDAMTSSGAFATSGGRVLCVTAKADDLLRARNAAYCACARINFTGCHYRCDIGAKSLDTPATYSSSGVSIDSGNRFVQRIKRYCSSTARPGSQSSIGGFGGTFDLKAAGYDSTATLVSGTDGVGTKLKIAHECNMHESIGVDLVAMCVNDILAHNAEPLFFLDYFATGRLDVELASRVVEGITEGCRQAGCALIGGETAEMPGFYDSTEYDIAGFAVGAVNKQNAHFPSIENIQEGDVVLALASSGIHSNGFSLVRKIICQMNHLNYTDQCPWDSTEATIGEALLKPTKIYIKSLLPILRDGLVKAAAHITGGGLLENIPRVLPKNLAVHLHASKWTIPDIFKWLCFNGRVPWEEMCRTFNCGLGMVLIVSADCEMLVRNRLQSVGETAYTVGVVTSFEADSSKNQVEIRGLEDIFPAYPLSYRKPEQKIRVAVLISGTGSNLKAILDYSLSRNKNCSFSVVCVVSNVDSAKGLQYAKENGLPHEVIPHSGKSREIFDQQVDAYLMSQNVEFVCLAGFMRILSADFVRKWYGRSLNVHPSLLPAFKGHDALRQTLRSGARLCGSTVHFVACSVDAGAPIAQASAPCWPESDDETRLQERVKRLEWQMYPEAVDAVVSGRATLTGDGRVVHRMC